MIRFPRLAVVILAVGGLFLSSLAPLTADAKAKKDAKADAKKDAKADAKKDAKTDGKDKEPPKDPHKEMIGKPAPEIAGDFAVNGKRMTLADLKGKVVVLDFWAVWCGPCVRSFPHLREMNTKFASQGLQMIGLTSYYKKVGFDKEKKAVKSLTKAMTPQEEQDMLKEFAAHHKLEYPLMTIPDNDRAKVYGDYKVRGIPQLVVIDKKGNVRMVKVGMLSAKTTEEVEMQIKNLLAE